MSGGEVPDSLVLSRRYRVSRLMKPAGSSACLRAGRDWLIPQPGTIDGARQWRTDDLHGTRGPSLPTFRMPMAGAYRYICVPPCARPAGSPPRSGGVLF
ncbi:hypothetical protein BO443_80049 [Burkholderia orbicola]